MPTLSPTRPDEAPPEIAPPAIRTPISAALPARVVAAGVPRENPEVATACASFGATIDKGLAIAPPRPAVPAISPPNFPPLYIQESGSAPNDCRASSIDCLRCSFSVAVSNGRISVAPIEPAPRTAPAKTLPIPCPTSFASVLSGFLSFANILKLRCA